MLRFCFSRFSRLCLTFSRRVRSFSLLLNPRRLLLSTALYSCGRGFRPGLSIDILNPGRVSIGDGFSSGKNVKIHAWISYQNVRMSDDFDILIKIGDNVFVNDNSYLTSARGVTIGDNCLLGSNVLITDNSHGKSIVTAIPRMLQPLETKGPVVIGGNVWICNNVVITSGVCIGRNSIIAANSVVSTDVPDNSLFGGVPARLIKSLPILPKLDN